MPKAKKKRVAKKREAPTKILIENSVKLQNSLADTLIVMNRLLKQQAEMVEIFKEASKHINDMEVKDENLKPLINRLDDLLNQNRTIAKGLILLEKYVKERATPIQQQAFATPQTQF